MLARCTDRASCSARVLMSGDPDERTEARFFVNGCLGDQLPPPP
jgi:hypothetical protein